MSRKKQKNQYDLTGEYGVGITSNTGAKFYFDLEDYDLIKDYYWLEHKLSTGYSALETWYSPTQSVIRMAWLIVGKGADHINHNPLDNRKSNLRLATQQQNVFNRSMQHTNTSGIIGVYWMKDRHKWRAGLRINGKSIYLGDFQDFSEAVRKRLMAEKQYFGEYAPQINLFRAYQI